MPLRAYAYARPQALPPENPKPQTLTPVPYARNPEPETADDMRTIRDKAPPPPAAASDRRADMLKNPRKDAPVYGNALSCVYGGACVHGVYVYGGACVHVVQPDSCRVCGGGWKLCIVMGVRRLGALSCASWVTVRVWGLESRAWRVCGSLFVAPLALCCDATLLLLWRCSLLFCDACAALHPTHYPLHPTH